MTQKIKTIPWDLSSATGVTSGYAWPRLKPHRYPTIDLHIEDRILPSTLLVRAENHPALVDGNSNAFWGRGWGFP